MTTPVLYSRSGCHLCEDFERAVLPLLHGAGLSLQVIDIDTDERLRTEFGWRIPVLVLDGQVICEGRLDEDAVRDALRLR